jgi:two-component system chemotaxis sensor kinase CheA
VLVVDDAVTTRAMERGLLELAGYQVKVAVDGVDAWTTLKTERFDLVVSDVDMPRMNGFELTQRIRADETLQDLPVVLVSALEGREDQERGIEVGANAYVVKSSFEQSNLLEIIHRLGVTADVSARGLASVRGVAQGAPPLTARRDGGRA